MNKKHPLYNELSAEYRKVWGKDDRMHDYCMNNTSGAIKLSTGGILCCEKESIETRFCFGEGMYRPLKEAEKMAQHARTSENYFIERNMQSFRRHLDNIKKHAHDLHWVSNYDPRRIEDECNIVCLDFHRYSWTRGESHLTDDNLLSPEDVAAIIAFIEQEMANHEKKVRAYLKRYGLSKVRAWTYWADE